jgi:hypothetical protein
MRTDLVRWIKDLGTLPADVYEAICTEAKAARRRAGGRQKMLRETRSEIVQVKVRGRFYYAQVDCLGWALLKPKEAK